jgi:hypothetical protein
MEEKEIKGKKVNRKKKKKNKREEKKEKEKGGKGKGYYEHFTLLSISCFAKRFSKFKFILESTPLAHSQLLLPQPQPQLCETHP